LTTGDRHIYTGHMNTNDLTLVVIANYEKHPEWRFGQTMFNTLMDYRPEKAEEIRGTSLDPFYKRPDDDEFWNRFAEWLEGWCV
jgi:transposase-like protein